MHIVDVDCGGVRETMLVHLHVECCVLILQLHCTWACCLFLFFA